jgi:hypothetical protein
MPIHDKISSLMREVEQEAQIQKLAARLNASKHAPQLIVNNQ